MDWSAKIHHAVDIKIWKELQTLVLSGGKLLSANTIHIFTHRLMKCKHQHLVSIPLAWSCTRSAEKRPLEVWIFKARALLSWWEVWLPQVFEHFKQTLLKILLFLLLFELECCRFVIFSTLPVCVSGQLKIPGVQVLFQAAVFWLSDTK